MLRKFFLFCLLALAILLGLYLGEIVVSTVAGVYDRLTTGLSGASGHYVPDAESDHEHGDGPVVYRALLPLVHKPGAGDGMPIAVGEPDTIDNTSDPVDPVDPVCPPHGAGRNACHTGEYNGENNGQGVKAPPEGAPWNK